MAAFKGDGFVIENNIIKGDKLLDVEMTPKFGKILLDALSKNPDHIAQIDVESGKQTTFREMRDRSIRCALWLKKQNIGTNDVVSTSSHSHLDFYIPILSTFYLGAIANPWENITLYSARRFMSLIQPKIMFCIPEKIEMLAEAAELEGINVKFVIFGKGHDKFESLEDILNQQTQQEVDSFEAEEIKDLKIPGLLVFSSGTTGLPKGILHSYEGLERNYLSPANFPIFPVKHCVTLHYLYPSWPRYTMIQLKNIIYEGTVIMHKKFDIDETSQVINKYKVNWLYINNACIIGWSKSEALRTNKYSLESLKVIATAGEKVNKNAFANLKELMPNVSIINTIALSETGAIFLSQTPKCKIVDSLGYVTLNTELKVIDESGKPLGPNEPGELCVRRDIMMMEYLKNPEETKNLRDDEGWIHTGDKVMYNEDGEFIYLDRIKELIKYDGKHVSPNELQSLVLTHPDIMEAAIVPTMDKTGVYQVPMAFVKKRPGSKVTEEDLIKLSETLEDHKKLRGGVVFLDELPHSASGKIAKGALKQMAMEISEKKNKN